MCEKCNTSRLVKQEGEMSGPGDLGGREGEREMDRERESKGIREGKRR